MREARIPDGTILYEETGSGEPVVFLHPFSTNHRHWRKVVPRLATHARCITPDLPVGAHTISMREQADLSPPGQAVIIRDFLDALGLDRVTLVGNDTGGAVAQVFASRYPDRVNRLALVSCDAYEVFPPRMFAYLKLVGRSRVATYVLAQSLRIPGVARLPIAFGRVTNRRIDTDVLRTYIEPIQRDAGIRRDVRKVSVSLDPKYTQAAAVALQTFDRPVLVAWGAEDRFFPRRLAERLAHELPRAQLEIVEGARTFVPEDNPDRLAELLIKFVTTT